MSLRTLLAPLTPIYGLGLEMRERRLQQGHQPISRLRLPVVSVGNLSTGGSGKTPLVIALAQALSGRGIAVDVLSRGYGRSGRTAARVDPTGSAAEYGDEPLLIAQAGGAPVYVAPQRYDAGALAESGTGSSGLAIHILDDGFQHRQLARDMDILLVSRADLQDRLLPAGNLREPLHAAKRADVLAIPADDPALESDLRGRGLNAPFWRLRRRMQIPKCDGPVLAFCGIARPAQFFAGLEEAGVRVAGRREFRDHYRYTQGDLDRLAQRARLAGATSLLTTGKDAIRLEALRPRLPIHIVGLITEFADEAAAMGWILNRLREVHR